MSTKGPELGQILNNRYQLRRIIGQGGMGQVYLAQDLAHNKPVALKTILSAAEAGEQKRFEREIRALRTLEHPGIVPFHDVGWEGDLLFFVMQYLPGVSLEQVLAARAAPASAEEIVWHLGIVLQLVSALEYLHQRHMVHRDLKPANVLLSLPATNRETPNPGAWIGLRDVSACLADFGLVKTREVDGSLTQTALGTPQYMAPEQIEAAPGVDERSDLYALGVILYRIASGKLPYARLSDVLARKPAAPLRELNPAVPELLEDTVRRLLEFEPYRRPSSAAEVRELLSAVLENRTQQAGEPLVGKLTQPSFCGRAAELATLRETALKAARGAGQWISITGERGTGKSWLLHRSDFKSHALVKDRLTTFAGRFTADRAHNAWRELIEGVLRHVERHHGAARAAAATGRWGRHLQSFLPQLQIDDLLAASPPLENITPEIARERIIDATIQVLTFAAEVEPRMLVLEDLHYGDEFDLEVLRRIVLASLPLPIVVITTHRQELESRLVGFERLQLEFQTEDRLTQINMPPLTRDEAKSMVESMLVPVRQLPADFVDALLERTAGVPLYLLHMLNSLWKRGLLKLGPQGWLVDSAQVRALPIPESTRSHFLMVLEEIPPQELKVLNMAAVAGMEFSFELLLDVLELDEFEIDALCRNLVHAGIFEERLDGFRFQHSFEQEILLERLSKPMRRRLHARIGRVLEKLHAGDVENHLGDIALHMYLGGDQDRGFGYLERAARKAEQSQSYRTALGYCEKALEFAQERGQRRRLLFSIGDLYQKLGDPERARRNYMDTMSLFTAVEQLLIEGSPLTNEDRDELRAYSELLLKFGDLYGQAGDVQPALRNYEKVGLIAQRIEDRSASAFALTRKGAVLAMSEDFDGAEAAYSAAVRSYEDLAPCLGFVVALNGMSHVAVYRGSTELALQHAQRALEISDQIGDRVQSAKLVGTIGNIQRRMGNYDAAVASLERSLELTEKLGDRRSLAMTLGNLGRLHTSRGEFRRALSAYQQARELFQQLGDKNGLLTASGNIGTLQLYQGDFEMARACFVEYLEEARRRGIQRFVGDAHTCLGALELECGRLAAAKIESEQGVAAFLSADDQNEAQRARVQLAAALSRQGQHAESERICDEVIATLTERRGLDELAVEALRVKAESQRARGRRDSAEELALNALAGFERLSMPYQEGFCCLTLARIYRELGFYWADQAGKFFERAMKRFEMLGAGHALAFAHLEYGQFFVMAEERERAREQFQSAEPLFVAHGLTDEVTRVRRAMEELNS
ncbi:MAG: serine/threonine-protein kinase PknK [Planctomycetota bacterium]